MPGRGRMALVTLLAVMLGLSMINPSSNVRADYFSGESSGSCIKNGFTAITLWLDGTVGKVDIRARLFLNGTAGAEAVGAHWQHGDKWMRTDYVRVAAGQTHTFWVQDFLGSTVYLQRGTTGKLTYNFFEPAAAGYAGCYSVADVRVTTTHFAETDPGGGTGGGGGFASPSPPPSPTASPTQPPASPNPSASPPAGWCYADGIDPNLPGTGMWIPCASPSPSPSPSPTAAPCSASITNTTTSWSWSTHVDSCEWFVVGQKPRFKFTFYPSGGRNSGDYMGTCLIRDAGGVQLASGGDGDFRGAPTPQEVYYPNLSQGDGNMVAVGTAGNAEFICRASDTGRGGTWVMTYYNQPQGLPSFTPAPSPTASPTAVPSGSPTLPPGYSGTPPPAPPGEPGAGIDCSGEQADLSICDPSVTYSFAPPSVDPDGVAALMEALQEKAPFGYAAQAVEALDSGISGAPGAALPSCFTLGEGAYAVEVCLPYEEVSDALSPWRNVFLAMVAIVFAVGLIRLAQSAAGGGTAGAGGA